MTIGRNRGITTLLLALGLLSGPVSGQDGATDDLGDFERRRQAIRQRSVFAHEAGDLAAKRRAAADLAALSYEAPEVDVADADPISLDGDPRDDDAPPDPGLGPDASGRGDGEPEDPATVFDALIDGARYNAFEEEPAGEVVFAILSGTTRSSEDSSARFVTEVAYSADEWERVTAPLRDGPPGPNAERFAIARSILIWEQILKEKFLARGIAIDAGGWWRNGDDDEGQMNCINVSGNATALLSRLESEGLLDHYTVLSESYRGSGWTEHWAATLGRLPLDRDELLDAYNRTDRALALYDEDPTRLIRLFAERNRWVFDRWQFDLGEGRILVQPYGDWYDRDDPDGVLGRIIALGD